MTDRIKEAFDGVHTEDGLKQRTRACLAQRIQRADAARPPKRTWLAPALACLVLAVFGLTGAGLYFTPVYAVSVDVNPSLELGVNRFDRVVSVTGFNGEADGLLNAVDMRYRDYAEALEALLTSEAMMPYLAEKALVSIAVVGDTEAKSAEMLNRVAACGFAAAPNVECCRGSRQEARAAREAGLSLGKYKAFLEWQALEPTVTAQEAQGLSMRQIRDRISEAADVSGNTLNGNGNGNDAGHGNENGNGAGHGNGNGYGGGNGSGNGHGNGNSQRRQGE